MVTVVLESEPATAREMARGFLGLYFQLPNYTASFKRLGFTDEDFTGGGSDCLVDALVVWGTDDAISTRLADLTGVTQGEAPRTESDSGLPMFGDDHVPSGEGRAE
ncbi:LLM class oxidoreductase [Streptomyces mirabilis]|uniref:hypothetical protein n=1 Tax=Streptomyces mirabilis TaxID=68239 RepID=UPI003428B35E